MRLRRGGPDGVQKWRDPVPSKWSQSGNGGLGGSVGAPPKWSSKRAPGAEAARWAPGPSPPEQGSRQCLEGEKVNLESLGVQSLLIETKGWALKCTSDGEVLRGCKSGETRRVWFLPRCPRREGRIRGCRSTPKVELGPSPPPQGRRPLAKAWREKEK